MRRSLGERVRGEADGGVGGGRARKDRERESVWIYIYVCVLMLFVTESPLQSPRIRERRKEEDRRGGGGGGGARTCPRALTAERAGLPLEIPNQRLFWILESN